MLKCIVGPLHGYDDFQGVDLPVEIGLSRIPKRLYGLSPKPSRPTYKHHLFNANIPKELFNAISEIATDEKKDEFKKERIPGELRRYLSKTPKELAGVNFVDVGGRGTCLRLQDFFAIPNYDIYGGIRKRRNKPPIKRRVRF